MDNPYAPPAAIVADSPSEHVSAGRMAAAVCVACVLVIAVCVAHGYVMHSYLGSLPAGVLKDNPEPYFFAFYLGALVVQTVAAWFGARIAAARAMRVAWLGTLTLLLLLLLIGVWLGGYDSEGYVNAFITCLAMFCGGFLARFSKRRA